MKKITLAKIIVVVLSIASPLIAGLYLINNAGSESFASLWVWFTFLYSAPLIIICGVLTYYLSKKSTKQDMIFMLGWIVPAIIACYYELFLTH